MVTFEVEIFLGVCGFVVNDKEDKQRETTPAEMKICHGQLFGFENSQTQILELKRITTLPLHK